MEGSGGAGRITGVVLVKRQQVILLTLDGEIVDDHDSGYRSQQARVTEQCLAQLRGAADTLRVEANGVTDNPIVIPEDAEVISGGNFHAEPVAFAADGIALAIAELGSISERRQALMVDASLSGLPPFLTEDSGLHSGFMMTQVTAAALVSENKGLAVPASVDSIPTSANQEDHVSMATNGARRLLQMADNLSDILASNG